jgi:VanZ family protein
MTFSRRIWAWGPGIIWMAVIFSLSSRSSLPLLLPGLPNWILRKVGHVVEYAILATLLWRALHLVGHPKRPAVAAFLIAVLYAVSDELHQTFVPGRHGTPLDVMIDTGGAMLGLAAVQLWLDISRAPEVHIDRRPDT